VSATPETEHQQQRRTAPDITAYLQTAVWDLAYTGALPPEEALRLHHAAQMLLSASEQLVHASLGAGAAPPADTDRLADAPGMTRLLLALVAFTRLDAVERGRLAPDLARSARSTLRRERAEAIRLTGWSVADLAREYGISPGAVRAAMMEEQAQ
jgi:hypothetical protein